MTAFSTTANEVDELVRLNRARTPRPATEVRKVPRSSISELNELDLDEIRDRYVRHGFDDRSPLTKVLDLIDLPRNVVGNVVFRAAGTPTEGLRKGALGLPVVTASDALKSLGVNNRVARGVLGFVGDVALDPLTYLGPAGWGLEVADNAGRAVRIGKGGAQGLKEGVKAVSRGTIPKHVPTKQLFDTLLANAPDEIRGADNSRKAAYLSEKSMGKIGAETKTGKAFSYLSRGLGGDARARGGAIAESLTKEGAEGEAVRAFVSRAGSAAGPGIGKGGSQVAHIPFTGISAKVPGFTRAGRAAEQDLAFARSAAPRAAEEIATPNIVRASQLAREIQDAEERGVDATDLVSELATMVERTEASPIDARNPREVFAMQKYLDEAEAGMAAARTRMKPHRQMISEVADADEQIDILDDASRETLADSVQDTFKAYQRYRGAVTGAVRNFAQNAPQDEALLQSALRFLGTDDRIVGRAAFAGPHAMLKVPDAVNSMEEKAYRLKTTIFGEKGTGVSEASRSMRHAMGPGARRAANTYIAETTDAIKGAFNEVGITPTGDDLDEAATLLMALAVRAQAQKGGAAIGDGVYYTRAFGSDELSPYLKRIEDAVKGGKVQGDLFKKLDAIAQERGAALIDELGEIEQGAGLLGRLRTGMVPNIPTPAGQQAIRAGKAYGEGAVATRVQSAARESFQKPRSMDQVRWFAPDGTQKRLFRAELDQATRFANDPQALEALAREGYPDVAAELQRLIDDVAEFNALPEKPNWRNTDPFEMNELAKQGRFSMLLDGQDPVGGFMQTNMVAAMAQRIGAHERAMARAEWGRYVDEFGLKVPEFKGAAQGDKIVASDGSQAQIVSSYDSRGQPVKAALIGGQKYRPVQGLDPHNPVAEMLGRESAQTVYHEQVASAIERTARLFDDPNVVLEGINALTRQWKNITLLHPSWTIFNLVGDSLNALQGGANPVHMFNPEFAKFAAQVQRYAHNPEKLRGITLNVRGVPVSGEQILNGLIEQKVIDGTMMEEQALKMVENKIFTMPSQRGGRFKPAVLTSDFKDAAQRYASARGGSVNRADRFKAVGYVASDRYLNNFLGPWFRLNQKVSNYVRTQTYLSFLADGFSPGAAARKVIESQFDYSDATRVESEVFRTLFPFYSWMRNNGAYQIKRLMDRPAYAAAVPKLQAAIEEAIAGDERVPQQLRPNWMRSALALQIGKDPQKRSAVLLGSGLPQADVLQYLTPILGAEGVMSFLHYFGSGLNPALNIPLQLASGQETFSGRTIGADAYSGDISAGEFLRGQIRPISEISKVGRAFEQGGVGQAVGRAFLGGRVQDMSEDRIRSSRLRELQDRERRIRSAINRSERSGDSDTSLRARVRLMELYQHMMETGFESEVPRWAKPQLEVYNLQ